MRIEASDDNNEPGIIKLQISGPGGDGKQPIPYAFLSFDIKKPAAKRLAEKLLDLVK